MGLCASCRFWTPGNSYPEYDRVGACERISGSAAPTKPAARIHPVGTSWLTTRRDFGCNLQEAQP